MCLLIVTMRTPLVRWGNMKSIQTPKRVTPTKHVLETFGHRFYWGPQYWVFFGSIFFSTATRQRQNSVPSLPYHDSVTRCMKRSIWRSLSRSLHHINPYQVKHRIAFEAARICFEAESFVLRLLANPQGESSPEKKVKAVLVNPGCKELGQCQTQHPRVGGSTNSGSWAHRMSSDWLKLAGL